MRLAPLSPGQFGLRVFILILALATLALMLFEGWSGQRAVPERLGSIQVIESSAEAWVFLEVEQIERVSAPLASNPIRVRGRRLTVWRLCEERAEFQGTLVVPADGPSIHENRGRIARYGGEFYLVQFGSLGLYVWRHRSFLELAAVDSQSVFGRAQFPHDTPADAPRIDEISASGGWRLSLARTHFLSLVDEAVIHSADCSVSLAGETCLLDLRPNAIGVDVILSRPNGQIMILETLQQ